MCRRCAVHFRRQWKLPLPAPPLVPRFGLLRVAGTLLVVTGLVLAARPFEGPRTPSTMTPPPETVLLPVPIEVPSPLPPVDTPRAPQRARVKSPRFASAAVKAVPPPAAPEPAPVVAEVAAEPVVAAVSTEPVVTTTYPPIEKVSVSSGRRRMPYSTTFAAIPHAGLAEQTP